MVRSIACASVLGFAAAFLWVAVGIFLIISDNSGLTAMDLWKVSAYVVYPLAFARWRGHVLAPLISLPLNGILYGASTALYLIVGQKLRVSRELM